MQRRCGRHWLADGSSLKERLCGDWPVVVFRESAIAFGPMDGVVVDYGEATAADQIGKRRWAFRFCYGTSLKRRLWCDWPVFCLRENALGFGPMDCVVVEYGDAHADD